MANYEILTQKWDNLDPTKKWIDYLSYDDLGKCYLKVYIKTESTLYGGVGTDTLIIRGVNSTYITLDGGNRQMHTIIEDKGWWWGLTTDGQNMIDLCSYRDAAIILVGYYPTFTPVTKYNKLSLYDFAHAQIDRVEKWAYAEI